MKHFLSSIAGLWCEKKVKLGGKMILLQIIEKIKKNSCLAKAK
jgi:hypothetical protein